MCLMLAAVAHKESHPTHPKGEEGFALGLHIQMERRAETHTRMIAQWLLLTYLANLAPCLLSCVGCPSS